MDYKANMRDKSLSISMVQNESIFGVEALLHTLVPSLKKKINNLQVNQRYFPWTKLQLFDFLQFNSQANSVTKHSLSLLTSQNAHSA